MLTKRASNVGTRLYWIDPAENPGLSELFLNLCVEIKKLFPDDKDPMKWSEFRKSMYEYLKHNQSPDGSWGQGGIGTVYTSAINLTILQLENGTLPIYQK